MGSVGSVGMGGWMVCVCVCVQCTKGFGWRGLGYGDMHMRGFVGWFV